MFQIFSSFVIIWNFNTNGYNAYALPYYELMPIFYCKYKNDPGTHTCTSMELDDPKVVSHEIDWNSPYSIHNWVEQMNLIDTPKSIIGLIGSAFFLGWVIGLFFVPRLGDLYGRKYPMIACMFLQFISLFALLFNTNIYGAIILLFLNGVSSSGRASTGFVMMLEYVPREYGVHLSVIFNLAEYFSTVAITLYFMNVKYWLPWGIWNACATFVAMSLLFILPESPLYYYSNH